MSRDELWKRSILTLPHGRFFNLMRNYLGEISTPFDKHKLIRRLSSFLRKVTIQEKIVALLGREEARVLTAVALLGEPTLAAMRTLLGEDLSLFAIDDLVTNLEDRLCLYRVAGAEAPRIAITPHLEKRLTEEVIDSSYLFAGKPCDPAKGFFWLADGVLLAMFSFLSGREWPLKKNGVMRKREEQQLRRVFPTNDPVAAFTAVVSRVLPAEGLLDSRMAVDGAVWRELAVEAPSRRRLKLLTRLGMGKPLDEAVLTGFLLSLAGRAYTPQDVRRLWRLVLLRSTDASEDVPLPFDDLVAVGALLPIDGGFTVNADLTSSEETPESTRAFVQPNFEVTLTRSVTLGQALPIAQAADIVRCDAALLFELTRTSFQRYLDQGGSVDLLVQAFQTLGTADLPQNVLFSIRSWEREYRRISLYRGVVLATDEEHGYVLDHSPSLARYIRKKLGPGVYLLNEQEEDAWRDALRRAGVEHVPEVISIEPDEEQPELAFETPGRDPALLPVVTTVSHGGELREDTRPSGEGDRIIGALLARLGDLDLSEEERAEIKTRVDRRLILLPDQLRPLRAGREKSEARGLDYLGKVRVIEYAIRESALVEIVERGASGLPIKMMVRPRELQKGGSSLHVVGASLPDSGDVRISVSRISLVRRVYSSLLE